MTTPAPSPYEQEQIERFGIFAEERVVEEVARVERATPLADRIYTAWTRQQYWGGCDQRESVERVLDVFADERRRGDQQVVEILLDMDWGTQEAREIATALRPALAEAERRGKEQGDALRTRVEGLLSEHAAGRLLSVHLADRIRAALATQADA